MEPVFEVRNGLFGTVLICFYANDMVGKMNYTELLVRKDAVATVLIINHPLPTHRFATTPPSFNISVIEETTTTNWYQIEGDSTHYVFTGLTGTDRSSGMEWDSRRAS